MSTLRGLTVQEWAAEVERLRALNDGQVELLKALQNGLARLEDENSKIGDLRAETERLRSANASSQRELQLFRDLRDNLEAENAATRHAYVTTVAELAKRNAENAELSAELARKNRLLKDFEAAVLAMKKQRDQSNAALAWFEARESLFIKSTEYYASDLAAWESLNPKPSE